MTTMYEMKLDDGEAKIIVHLYEGRVEVRHGETDALLMGRLAPEGFWDTLFAFLREHTKPLKKV